MAPDRCRRSRPGFGLTGPYWHAATLRLTGILLEAWAAGGALPRFGVIGPVLSRPAGPKLVFAGYDLCDPEPCRLHNRFNPIITRTVDNLAACRGLKL